MIKKDYLNNLEIKNKEITSIVGNSKNTLINLLCKKYKIDIVNDLFKFTNNLVKVMIPNSKKSQELIKLFEIENLLEENYEELGIEDKAIIKIATHLSFESNIIIFNDILSYLNRDKKEKVIKYIKSKKITLINITSDVEEVLYGDNLIVLNNNEIIFSGKTLEVLKNEKQLKDLGIYLPFIIDLSIQLNLYGLIKKIYKDEKKLIGDLWK